jgi:5-methylcytosine-specific restriction endonuclease McrA
MEKHVVNYMKAFGYDQSSFIPCEVCGAKAIDIHHVVPRSKFGSKRKHEQDAVKNLVALCRPCHDQAHGYLSIRMRIKFREIIKKRD